MPYKGYKIETEEFSLEVISVNKITNYVTSIKYVVKKGNNELTEGIIYVTPKQDSRKVLRETLQNIINAVKRVRVA